MKPALKFGIVGVVLLEAASSSAQTSSHALAAEQLFRDGRDLIAKHRYKEACDKLGASQRIDPAVGTLVSLGECFSGLGRTASAWLAYRSAIALATERNDPRKAAAEERVAAIEPQISNLVIHVNADAREGAQITIDGESFGRDVLGTPMPIDPGPHSIVATAPGYRPWSTRVQVGALRDNVTVEVPALELLPDPGAVEHARSVAATKRTAGLAMGGIGLVGVGVGVVLGLQAIVKIRDANTACPTGPICTDASAVQENQTGRSFADASSVTIPVSAAVLVAGAVLFLTSRAPHGAEIGAEVSPGGARVKVAWSW
jgi:hypothetical protein